jgi:hypothetical protein
MSVDRRAEHVAWCRLPGEREAQHLAGERGSVLREILARGIAERHVEQAIRPDGDPRPVVDAGAGNVRQQHLGRA